ncbi:High-affinity methionine permease [Lasiodiplodia theobromae]|uniref:High-affinity methionine permease n=1 Tax=Lasiodiplodia theobromae TaxID=45133 RepID=A0A5N5CW56_9PEZI|nr:High-affinity methionine permease [Lasiodiplodia theobromae]
MATAHDSEKLDPVRVASPASDSNVLKVGSLAFVGEQGGNGSAPTFQEATGAPVEQESPLGYKVKWFTIIFLNIGQMIGTGVFSTLLAQYAFKMSPEYSPSDWEQKGVAIASYTLAIVLLIVSNRLSLWLSDIFGFIKVSTLIFISITGLVVLGGNTSVADPNANFRDAFAGTSSNGNAMANALVKVTFAYEGYANAFNMMNEVKDPVRTIKKSAPVALLIVAVMYTLCNVAYFAAVPSEEMKAAEQTAATLFFTKVFGENAAKGLNILVIISAFGNLISNLIGQQGVLPWPKFWTTTRPFGTPIGPYLLKWGMTVLMIVAPPAGDAFNFVVDLKTYPDAVFFFLMAAGVYIIRRHRSRIGVGRSEFRAWDAAVIIYLLVNLFLLVMPWYPPEGGATGGDVSFWYATYCVVGIGIILMCVVYYWIWIYVLPRFGGYAMRQKLVVLEDGAVMHKIVKVPKDQLAEWDANHDVSGRSITAENGVVSAKRD